MRRDRNQRGLAPMLIWWPFMFKFHRKCIAALFQCNCNATAQLNVSCKIYPKLLLLFINYLNERCVKSNYHYWSSNFINSIYAILPIIRINVYIYDLAYQKWIYNMYLWRAVHVTLSLFCWKLKELMHIEHV